MNGTSQLEQARELCQQSEARLQRSQQLQHLLCELQPLRSPARALPWRLALALATVFGLGVAAAWLGMG